MPAVEFTCVETDCIQGITVDVPDSPDEADEADPVECPNCGHDYYPGYWRDNEPTAYPTSEREKPAKFVRLENHEKTVDYFEEHEYDPEKHGIPPEEPTNADTVPDLDNDAGAPNNL